MRKYFIPRSSEIATGRKEQNEEWRIHAHTYTHIHTVTEGEMQARHLESKKYTIKGDAKEV